MSEEHPAAAAAAAAAAATALANIISTKLDTIIGHLDALRLWKERTEMRLEQGTETFAELKAGKVDKSVLIAWVAGASAAGAVLGGICVGLFFKVLK